MRVEASAAAERRGDVAGTGHAEQRDRQIAERGHDLSAGACADARAIFVEGNVADPVEAVFNRPMVAAQGEETFGIRVLGLQAADAINGFGARFLRDHFDGIAPDGEDLGGIRKVEVIGEFRAGPDGADFQAAMAFIGCDVLRGE